MKIKTIKTFFIFSNGFVNFIQRVQTIGFSQPYSRRVIFAFQSLIKRQSRSILLFRLWLNFMKKKEGKKEKEKVTN